MKSRMYYIGVVIFVMLLGLGSRAFEESLPPFVAQHAGDAFWASMIYFGVRVVTFKKKIYWAVIASILFCIFIEFTQLYQADWIRSVRSTTLGGLILGRGFLVIDLFRYAVGIVLSYAADKYVGKSYPQ